jgi:ribosomal peptide maturation radical SAM protein 1
MPWTSLGEPSLGLGVLGAELAAAGIEFRIRHVNLFLLQHLRATTYLALANTFALNDFVFSGVLDPDLTHLQRRWLRTKVDEMLTLGLVEDARFGGIDGVVDQIIGLRQRIIPAWLETVADEISQRSPTLVGFTCMFDQTIAAVALAKLLKARMPDVVIALGGYALRAPTGETVIESFPWIDAICTGEGEKVIVPLAEASTGSRDLTSVPGILARAADGIHATAPPMPFDMAASKTPEFGDYFADLGELASKHQVRVEVDTLPLETSRGCWWGAVSHCVFCGINDEDLVFRARPANNTLHSLDELRHRHQLSSFRFSDYILPYEYYRTLLPLLGARRRKFQLACEMKANSSPERFELLARAGFREVQPGIESFSSDVLRKMDKGVGAVHNVQTLILGKRAGITIHYNFLYGLPDDDLDEYRRMERQLPALIHLDPPLSRTEVQITRYAPLQADPGRFEIPVARFEPSYQVIFSEGFLARSGFRLNDYCYYFARPFENPPALQASYARLNRIVDDWKRAHVEREVALTYTAGLDGLLIHDSRRTVSPEISHLAGVEADLYELTLPERTSVRALMEAKPTLDAATVRRVVDELEQRQLIFREGDALIGLALPAEAVHKQAGVQRGWAVA